MPTTHIFKHTRMCLYSPLSSSHKSQINFFNSTDYIQYLSKIAHSVQKHIFQLKMAQRRKFRSMEMTFSLKTFWRFLARKTSDTDPVGGVSEVETMSITKHEYFRACVLDPMPELKCVQLKHYSRI